MVVVTVLLCAIVVWQQYFYTSQIQKLIDKLMSRDFSDYKRTIDPPKAAPKHQEPLPYPEDMSVLQNFQLP
jgi:hypothetical protein